MISMTGYGRGKAKNTYGSAEVQLTSVNKRGLEISVGLPRELAHHEAAITELLKRAFERGKLQLSVRIAPSPTRDSAQIQAQWRRLKAACRTLRVPFEADAELVLELINSNYGSDTSDIEKLATAVIAATRAAIVACKRAAAAEGTRLKKDFSIRLRKLGSLYTQAQKQAPSVLPAQRERLYKNLQQAGLSVDIADERVLKELALWADRVDISEELTRIDSHLTALAKMIGSSGSIGRQIEFTLQELLREWNTLGNKSPQIQLVHIALAAKNEIERLREQAANIA